MCLYGESFRVAAVLFEEWFIARGYGDAADARQVLNAWLLAESQIRDEELAQEAEGLEQEDRAWHEELVRVPWARFVAGGIWHRGLGFDDKTHCGRSMERAVETHMPGELKYDGTIGDGAPDGQLCKVCLKSACSEL